MRTAAMRTLRFSLLVLFVGCGASAGAVLAQPAPGGRDCQTIRTCNFARGGLYRGCLSSYSCRVCHMVSTSCRVGGGPRRICQEMRCNWG